LPKPDTNGFDYFQHAIADARQVLLETMMPLSKEEVDPGLVIPGPWTQSRCFYFDYLSDEIFSDSREHLLTEDDICNYWKYVDAADREESQSFVTHELHPTPRTQ
jgi:hypothetical protein